MRRSAITLGAAAQLLATFFILIPPPASGGVPAAKPPSPSAIPIGTAWQATAQLSA